MASVADLFADQLVDVRIAVAVHWTRCSLAPPIHQHASTNTELLFSMARIRNVFEIIELYGHDENFEPQPTPEFTPTRAPAGSRQKLDILAERIQRGMPLWHPEDSTEFAGVMVGAGEPD